MKKPITTAKGNVYQPGKWLVDVTPPDDGFPIGWRGREDVDLYGDNHTCIVVDCLVTNPGYGMSWIEQDEDGLGWRELHPRLCAQHRDILRAWFNADHPNAVWLAA